MKTPSVQTEQDPSDKNPGPESKKRPSQPDEISSVSKEENKLSIGWNKNYESDKKNQSSARKKKT